MKDDYTTNSHYLTCTFLFNKREVELLSCPFVISSAEVSKRNRSLVTQDVHSASVFHRASARDSDSPNDQRRARGSTKKVAESGRLQETARPDLVEKPTGPRLSTDMQRALALILPSHSARCDLNHVWTSTRASVSLFTRLSLSFVHF